MVKNCDRGQHFQAQAHSFSPYGLTLSQQITCLFFSCSKLVLQPITNGLVYATLSLNQVARHLLNSKEILPNTAMIRGKLN